MSESRIARGLMLLGAGIGILSAVVWGLEFRLLNLPDWLIRVAMIKLAFIASVGLLAGGALVGRHASRSVSGNEPDLLPPESAEPLMSSARHTPDAVVRRKRGSD